MPRRRPRPTVTLQRPRISVLEVLDRVRVRMVDIQVWDVAGTMTFYTLLSVLPAAIALVSVVSMLGLEERTVHTLGGLVAEIFPSVDPLPYERTLLRLAEMDGGWVWLTIGTLGAILSASNGVAAFHRAMHRVYDTREGRPFLWFRTIVFGETIVLLAVVLLLIGIVVVGGEATQRIGEYVGIPTGAFTIWNLLKWPVLLVILILTVSLAYYLFPNVQLPRYRLMTLGSTLAVLVLFVSAYLVGQIAGQFARVSEIMPALNGIAGILLLIWLANIVIVGGAALDAEILRARQLARGLPAWHHLVLAPHATHSLDFLQSAADADEEIGRIVADAARTGESATGPRTPRIVESTSFLAVNPPQGAALFTGDPGEHPAPAVQSSQPLPGETP